MSDKVLVIMLGHKSMTGKDTFFSFVKDLGFKRVAFADKLKSTVADLYNFSHDQMHGNSKDVMDERYPNDFDPKEYPVPAVDGSLTPKLLNFTVPVKAIANPEYKEFFTPRRILQIFGQQQRSLDPDIWAKYIFNVEIPKLVAEGHNKIVVTDFRFRNEAKVAQRWQEANKESGLLKLVKINRPGILARSGASDISENDLNDFDGWNDVIVNNDSIEAYRDQVLALIDKYSI